MKSLYLLLIAAAVTPAFAQNPNNSANNISYDRVYLGYSSNSVCSTVGFGGTALLGQNFLIGGGYSDINYKNSLEGVSGTSTGFSIGYKLTAGVGDIVFNVGYEQLQATGAISSVAFVGNAEATSYSIGYRVKLNPAFELITNYTNSRVNTLAGGYDLSTGQSLVQGTSDNINSIGVNVRYYINKSFDVNVGYNISSGHNTWGLSAGYNF